MPQHACSCPSGCGVGEDPGGGSMTSVQQKCESSGTALRGMLFLSYMYRICCDHVRSN